MSDFRRKLLFEQAQVASMWEHGVNIHFGIPKPDSRTSTTIFLPLKSIQPTITAYVFPFNSEAWGYIELAEYDENFNYVDGWSVGGTGNIRKMNISSGKTKYIRMSVFTNQIPDSYIYDDTNQYYTLPKNSI